MTALQERKLTRREDLFVTLLLKDGNQSEAYRAAGFRAKDPRFHASRLATKGNVAAAIEKRRSAMMVKLESDTIATLRELKEHQTARLRGADFTQDIEALKGMVAGIDAAVEEIKTFRDKASDPEARLAATVRMIALAESRFDKMLAIGKLRIDHAEKSNQAAVTLFKVKGALDPSRKPNGDRQTITEDFMLALVKNTDGPSLRKKMEGLKPIDV